MWKCDLTCISKVSWKFEETWPSCEFVDLLDVPRYTPRKINMEPRSIQWDWSIAYQFLPP